MLLIYASTFFVATISTPAAVTMLCNDMMEAHMILEKGEMKEQKRAVVQCPSGYVS